jgi:hypothetical protein
MKKNLLILLTLFAGVFAADAQINQGTILVGASSNLAFASESPDGGDSFSRFNINGKAGYFFVENLAGGVRLGYDKLDEQSEFTFGIFGRYYINGNIITGLGISTNSFDPGGSSDNFSYTGINLEGGYAAFIADNLAIEPTLNLDLFSGDYDATRFGFNIGFTLYFNKE